MEARARGATSPRAPTAAGASSFRPFWASIDVGESGRRPSPSHSSRRRSHAGVATSFKPPRSARSQRK